MVDYEKITKLVECELDKITAMPELNETSLGHLDKLIDILKDVEEMEYGGEMTSANMYDNGASYRSGYYNRYGSNGRSYRNGTSNRVNYGMNRGRSMRSGGELMEHLEMAMDTAQTEQERQAIQGLMNEITNM